MCSCVFVLISLSLRICCKFAHFLISTIAKEILMNMYCRHGGIIREKNAHAPSEVVGRASEVAGGPFKFLTSILYILLFLNFFLTKQPHEL